MKNNPAATLYQNRSSMPNITKNSALLCIDMQYHDAHPGYGFFKDYEASHPFCAYYFDRLYSTVFPNVKKIQDYFRQQKLEIIHLRIESLTQDGRERSHTHKAIGCLVPKGSKGAEFIPEVAPIENEIIISKTSSGGFEGTSLHYILRNLSIDQLIITGVLTNECVESTVRSAADLGYANILVEDGVAAMSESLHANSLNALDQVYARVFSAAQLIG